MGQSVCPPPLPITTPFYRRRPSRAVTVEGWSESNRAQTARAITTLLLLPSPAPLLRKCFWCFLSTAAGAREEDEGGAVVAPSLALDLRARPREQATITTTMPHTRNQTPTPPSYLGNRISTRAGTIRTRTRTRNLSQGCKNSNPRPTDGRADRRADKTATVPTGTYPDQTPRHATHATHATHACQMPVSHISSHRASITHPTHLPIHQPTHVPIIGIGIRIDPHRHRECSRCR
ncbi:uncharacterized protein J3D65DRAFT_611694 [Phyllosticta citribraziliensis]|uniref:Uncharacterized protein n=1 Tax=Phyllosticta citribraziliensis TaxID=989973 RepID=A0ABR1MCQ2_9PEZI